MENTLKIGVTVDKDGLRQDFKTIADLTQQTSHTVGITFDECASVTRRAMRGISDSVKQAADSVSAESMRVAAATRTQSAAMGDLRRAQIVARNGKIDEATSTSLLAAAQERAATATAALTSAKAAEAASSAVEAANARLAGETLSAESLRVAAATREQILANAELARMQALVSDSAVGDADATELLAVAQTRATAAAAEVAEAKEAEAAAVARAAEEESLSQNVVVAAFQRAAMAARESGAIAGEQIVAVAEKAELSADGIAAGFGGLSKLLGAGIVGGFAAHMLDSVAELNVELEDLHEKTGMAVQDLAGLRLLAKSKGLDFTTVSMGLIRLGKAMYEARQGMVEDQEAFSSLGISMKEVQTDSVEQMFYRVSKALGENRSLVIADGTALELFGRGGKEMVPMLREFGGELQSLTHQQGALTGMTDQSGAAAQKWLQTMQDLTAELHSALNPALIRLVEVLPYVETGFRLLETGITMTFGLAIENIVTVTEAVYKLGGALSDLQSLRFTSVFADIKGLKSFLVDTKSHYEALGAAISGSALQARVDWNERHPDLVHPGAPMGDGGGYADGGLLKRAKQELAELERKKRLTRQEIIDFWQEQLAKAPPGSTDYREVNLQLGNLMQRGAGAGRSAGTAEIRSDEAQLNQLKLGHEVTLQEEIGFWQKRLAAVRKGSAEYLAIEAKLAPLMQREMRAKPGKQLETQTDNEAMKGLVDDYIDSQRQKAQAAKEAAKEETDAVRAGLQDESAVAAERYRDIEHDTEFEVEMSKTTAAKRLETLRAAAQQEYNVRLQAVRAMEVLDLSAPEKYRADLEREMTLYRDHNRQMVELAQQSAKQMQQQWDRYFKDLNNGLIQTLNQWVSGSHRMTEAFAQMFRGLESQLLDWVAKWLLHQAEMWTETKLMQVLGLTAQRTTQGAANVAAVTGDAAVAAAGAMAYYSAINPPLAPAMAAVAYSSTMAYAPMASFDKGGVVGRGGLVPAFAGINVPRMHAPILAKAGERVLTPEQNRNFEAMVNGERGGGGPSVTQHLHYEPTVQAYDRAGMRATLQSHADDILDIVRQGYRAGALA